jgi:hypothetical protein
MDKAFRGAIENLQAQASTQAKKQLQHGSMLSEIISLLKLNKVNSAPPISPNISDSSLTTLLKWLTTRRLMMPATCLKSLARVNNPEDSSSESSRASEESRVLHKGDLYMCVFGDSISMKKKQNS